MNFLENSSNTALAVGLIFLTLLSSFFSSMEAAYLSLGRVNKKRIQKRKTLFSILSSIFLKNFDVFITVLLIAILINNILATLTAKTLAERWVASTYPNFNLQGLLWSVIFIFGFAFIFLIFCEVTPKRIALQFSESVAYFGSIMAAPFYFVLYPIAYVCLQLTNRFFIRAFISSTTTSNKLLEKKNFMHYLKMSSDAGVLKEVEMQVLENLITYKNTPIKTLLIPRKHMEGLNLQTLPESDNDKLIAMIKKFKYKNIPIYDGLKDHLIGVLSKSKLIFHKHRANITKSNLHKYLDKPALVPETKSIVDVLADLNAHNEEIAIVTDEHGGIEGIVTYSDIVEQLFGKKEAPLTNVGIQKISLNVYLVHPHTTLDAINRHFKVNLQCDEVDTIGGYVLEHLREIPKAGQFYRDNLFEYTVKKSSKTAIQKMTLKRMY